MPADCTQDKLDWAAKLGLGPLAGAGPECTARGDISWIFCSGGEVPIPPGAEVPRNVRDAMAQKKQVKLSMGAGLQILNWGLGVGDVCVGNATGSVGNACRWG